ncbi:MAG: 2-dehydropantoate 2-reductase [Chthoniobacterales bacterium]
MAEQALPRFRIAVVGSGAIGGYYGAKLAHAGADVHFLMRSDLLEVRRSGIRIEGRGENIHVADVNCYASAGDIGPCDIVLIAVKTTSNGDLPHLIPPLLHSRTILLTLQNGLGNEEYLAKNFGAERVLGGLCFVCLNRVSPKLIEHYDHGRVAIGEFSGPPRERTHQITEMFKRSGVNCRVVEDLSLERWRKLVWNIPFNGLSVAAGGIDTEAMLADEDLRELLRSLMDEVIAAANQCGHALPASEGVHQIERTESMGQYKPSTLIDFERGKPLEIEAIWGEPLRRAAAAGAKTPQLELLYAILKSLNQKLLRSAAARERAVVAVPA